MLAAAGVPHDAIASEMDEEAAKVSLAAEGPSPRDLADALAELKAVKLSVRFPEAMVLGCDQVAALDGEVLGKPESREVAGEQLRRLRGKAHHQLSAAVICEGGQPVWRHVDSARLTVRDFSDGFLASYLDAEWPAISGCAGGYRLEALGAQLFARIEGSHFTILGLPLLPLLPLHDYLRARSDRDMTRSQLSSVIPAKAGIQLLLFFLRAFAPSREPVFLTRRREGAKVKKDSWIPAFAGMTGRGR